MIYAFLILEILFEKHCIDQYSHMIEGLEKEENFERKKEKGYLMKEKNCKPS